MENQICSHWAQFSDPSLIFQFKKGNTALYGSVLMLLKSQEHQNISNISQYQLHTVMRLAIQDCLRKRIQSACLKCVSVNNI